MTSCGFFGADAIIFDLEDAVSPDEKDAARILVKYAVTNVERCRSEIIVRVNAADTPLFAQDLEAIVPQRPDYIMLPKTASRQTVCGCDAAIGEIERRCGMEPGTIGLIALIETALGVENAFEIATASPRVRALFLGAEDLSATCTAAGRRRALRSSMPGRASSQRRTPPELMSTTPPSPT